MPTNDTDTAFKAACAARKRPTIFQTIPHKPQNLAQKLARSRPKILGLSIAN
jgi:hypothetical protein